MTEEQIFKLKLAEAVESNVPVNSNYEAIRKKYSKETSQEKARIKKAEAEIERIKAEMEKIKNNPDAFSLKEKKTKGEQAIIGTDWRGLEQALAEAEQALNGASDAEIQGVMDNLNI